MTHKVCPVCGGEPMDIGNGEVLCTNEKCLIYCMGEGGAKDFVWDAPRPLEEKMKADIEILRAEIDDLRDSLRNERIFSSKWLHERDAARAELEAYKARTCGNCRWCMDYNDGPYCNNDEASTITYISHDCCCWAWEAKEAQS